MRQFLRASAGRLPGPTEAVYWSKATSKMVPVASRVTEAVPAGQPVPMAVMLRILTSWGSGVGAAGMARAGMAAAPEARKEAMAKKRILKVGWGLVGWVVGESGR